jgi:hypothetical protein
MTSSVPTSAAANASPRSRNTRSVMSHSPSPAHSIHAPPDSGCSSKCAPGPGTAPAGAGPAY